MPASKAYSGPTKSDIIFFKFCAKAGLVPLVEIAILTSPRETIAGKMKEHSSVTSTTLHKMFLLVAVLNINSFRLLLLLPKVEITSQMLSRSDSVNVRCSNVKFLKVSKLFI
jgi:fructose-bisphosphate aldolase class 1